MPAADEEVGVGVGCAVALGTGGLRIVAVMIDTMKTVKFLRKFTD